MTVKVVLSTGTSLERTGGEKEFEVDARNLRGVIKAMDARFPGLGEYLEEETTVAIDGQTPIYEVCSGAYFQRLAGSPRHASEVSRLVRSQDLRFARRSRRGERKQMLFTPSSAMVVRPGPPPPVSFGPMSGPALPPRRN